MEQNLNVVKNVIDLFRKRLIQQFGQNLVIFDIELRQSKNNVDLSGVIGTVKQKNKFIGILRSKKISIVDNIKTLSDPDDQMEIGWGKSLLDQVIYRTPDEQSKLATHILSDETFRVLRQVQGWLLIQLEDLSVGWISNINKDYIIVLDNNNSLYNEFAERWQKVKRPLTTKLQFMYSDPVDLEKKLTDIFSPYLGMSYIFGGRSSKLGFDCSGLIQNIIYKLEKILLPKNSLDQIVLGRDANIKEYDKNKFKIGDVVFIRIRKKIPHSGIVTSKGILHAEGLNQKIILIDSFEDISDPHNFANQWQRDFGKVVRFFRFENN